MRKHLDILSELFKAKKLRQEDVAKAMGFRSGSAVGMMLRGERGMTRLELEIMCDIAGITVLALAGQSDDLKITKRKEAAEAASIIDEISPEDLRAAMHYLRTIKSAK